MWAGLTVGLGLLVGCAGDAPQAADSSDEDQEVRVKEPVQGVPNAPPFGSPREKLSPGEIVTGEED